MLKKKKEDWRKIAEEINKAREFNKENPSNKISRITFDISRGVYNMGEKTIQQKIQEEMNEIIPYELKLIDNVDYCMLFINIKD